MKPTSSAAMRVPSRTPASWPASRKESTTAITVMDTSKQTLVVPKSVFQVMTMARTKDSPGSMATSPSTSRYTPKASTTQPMSR